MNPYSLIQKFFAVVLIVLLAMPAVAEEEKKSAEAPAASAKPKPAPAPEAKACLYYEPGVVKLKGHLKHLASAWVLELDNSLCIDKIDSNSDYYPEMDNVKDVILWQRERDPSNQYDEFADKDVIIDGTMHHRNIGSVIGANTGDVMIMVSYIDLQEKDAKK